MNITVIQDGEARSIAAYANETLLDVLQRAGYVISAPCGGNGTCGKCTVTLVDAGGGTTSVLACQTKVEPSVTVKLATLEELAVELLGDISFSSDAKSYGVAVDIGTTTVGVALVDLDTGQMVGQQGFANPQAAFGADVISRISACNDPASLERMGSLVSDAVYGAVKKLCEGAGVQPEDAASWVIAGNTVMECLAAGFDPTSIGVAPFTPPTLFGETCALQLSSCKAGEERLETYFMPAVSGYVGGDITAGLLAIEAHNLDKPTLFIDVGTNGEMALVNKGTILCCATAAGPAFEGAGITCGMSAFPGAIDRVVVTADNQDIEVHTVSEATPKGICGSGLLDSIAALLELEVIDETGRLESDSAQPLTIVTYQDQPAVYLDEAKQVALTQADIRAVQLAKAAIRAGIETLLHEAHLTYDDIDIVVLAGGFGMHINARSAAAVGMIPPALVQKVQTGGNTSLQGACMALNPGSQKALEDITNACDYIELSNSSFFNQAYIEYMGFDE